MNSRQTLIYVFFIVFVSALVSLILSASDVGAETIIKLRVTWQHDGNNIAYYTIYADGEKLFDTQGSETIDKTVTFSLETVTDKKEISVSATDINDNQSPLSEPASLLFTSPRAPTNVKVQTILTIDSD